MIESEMVSGALSPYRVLDLTTGGYLLAGLFFAQAGADVIKVEPPGGDPARRLGPFYHDDPHPEKSLFWFAYNVNKKSVTLKLDSADGREIFLKLAKTADFIIDSFAPGYLADIGLDYPVINRANRRVIMTSITPFGQAGPYSKYQGPDIVLMAMGGRMYVDGSPDHPPTRISFPQAEFNAAMDAVIGTLVAHHYREQTGEGQYVDVAGEPGMAYTICDVRRYWDLNRIILKRSGKLRVIPGTGVTYGQQWRCKDGFVTYWIIGGTIGAKTMKALTKWMDEEGMAPPVMTEMDWDAFGFASATQELMDAISQPIARFFESHTKTEIYEGVIQRRITLLPVNTIKDLRESPQLAVRDFWVELEHEELGRTLTYPGAPVKMSATPLALTRRAPTIGEHNEPVYQGELGLSREKLVMLKQAGVI